MIKQVTNNKVFENIINDHDVYCIDLNNIEIKWANEMTVDAIKEKMNSGWQFIIDEKTTATGFDGIELKRIDVSKFHQKLHDENITKTELAKLSGVTPNTISRAARGSRQRKATLERICNALKCSAEDILED